MNKTADLFKYLTYPINITQREVMFRANNIIPEYVDLYHDFTISLLHTLEETYLGDDVITNDEEIFGHYKWCFFKTADIFEKEGFRFSRNTALFDYLYLFFLDNFYSSDENRELRHYKLFFDDLFNLNKNATKAEMEMLIDFYGMFRDALKD